MEILADQHLGSCDHAVERGVGAVIGCRPAVVDEPDEPHVFDSLLLTVCHREKYRLRDDAATTAVEFDAVGIGIDHVAGPSEIFVLADESGDPRLIATDLLTQAENDVRTRVGLITTDRSMAERTAAEVTRQLETLETAEIAGASWEDYGEIVLCEDEQAMIAYSDHVAAEHLQVHTSDLHALAAKLRNYGSLFIGENASVVYSDKTVGTNHTLPTAGAGHYTGGLWVGSYVKIPTHQWLEDEAVLKVGPPASRQSAREGLDAHIRPHRFASTSCIRRQRLDGFPGVRDATEATHRMTFLSAPVMHTLDALSTLFVFAIGLVFLALVVVFGLDRRLRRDAIFRNYPVIGHLLYILSGLGEFLRQYFFAMDRDELPFNRADRTWVEAAKAAFPAIISKAARTSCSRSAPPNTGCVTPTAH